MTRRRIVLPGVIALGSNLGDRVATLSEAVRQIADIDGITITAVSGLVESHAVKPQGTDASGPDYLNAVALVQSALHPEQLLVELGVIESRLGRVRGERWGDRTLDLDIISFGPLRINSESLTLPHPRAWERPFVIVPWLQIEPDAVLAGHGRIDSLPAARSSEVWDFDGGSLFGRLDS